MSIAEFLADFPGQLGWPLLQAEGSDVPRLLMDTNVLVSYFTDRDEEQQATARQLFEECVAGDHDLLVPSFIVLELIYVLRNLYGVSPPEAKSHVAALLSMPGLEITEAGWARQLLALWPEAFSDPPDAALAAVALRLDVGVATFDKRTRKGLELLGIAVYP